MAQFVNFPLAISMVGVSEAGKTTLIEKLLKEFNKRKRTAAAVKYCPHGFDMDVEGKDSWRFKKAGAKGTAVTSPSQVGIIKDTKHTSTLKSIAEQYFCGFDIVLGEGFGTEKEVAKILILRKGISDYTQAVPDDILALVSDFEIKTDKPVFKPDDISAIADFIESLFTQENKTQSPVVLLINEKPTAMNAFVQSALKNIILGFVTTLRVEDKEVKQIKTTIKMENGTESSVTLAINKKPVLMNPFVQSVLKNVVQGFVASLRMEDKKLKQIEAVIGDRE